MTCPTVVNFYPEPLQGNVLVVIESFSDVEFVVFVEAWVVVLIMVLQWGIMALLRFELDAPDPLPNSPNFKRFKSSSRELDLGPRNMRRK